MSTCTRCHATKPRDAFTRDARRTNGLDCICKPCRAESRRISRASAPVQPPIALVRDVPRSFGDRREALEVAISAAGVDEPINAAALNHARNLADGMDAADPFDLAKLNPQYLAALTACGLTPGARKPAVVEDAKPVLSIASY